MTERSAMQNDRNTRRRQWGALYAALALFVVFGVASAAGVAHAQTTITVTSMSDPSASGECTLRDAITIANGGSWRHLRQQWKRRIVHD